MRGGGRIVINEQPEKRTPAEDERGAEMVKENRNVQGRQIKRK